MDYQMNNTTYPKILCKYYYFFANDIADITDFV